MDSLGGIAMFVQVADSGSFSATGRLLGLSSSAVGKSVARMEARLGARLFQRSTRHLALTAEGENSCSAASASWPRWKRPSGN